MAQHCRLLKFGHTFHSIFYNLLQNLFGEGALSASFIPVYAALAGRGESREADRVAGAVASLLGLMIAVLVLLGVLATPILIAVIAINIVQLFGSCEYRPEGRMTRAHL